MESRRVIHRIRQKTWVVFSLLISYPALVHTYAVTDFTLAAKLAACVLFLLVSFIICRHVIDLLGFLGLAGAAIAGLNVDWQYLLYSNPVVINLLLAWVFARTLISNRTPLITQIASELGDNIDAATQRYTRWVTILWTGVFLLLALESAVLALWAPKAVWSLMTGFANYLIVFLLFPVELILRRYCLPQQKRTTFWRFMTRLAQLDFGKLFANRL